MTILGGDSRSLFLAKLLHDDGKDITLYGLENDEISDGLTYANDLHEAIDISNIIIGPLPFENDRQQLHTPFYAHEIKIEDVFKKMKKNQILLGGHIADRWFRLAQNYKVTVIDYFAREELQVLNAIPTAEGAIQIAMKNMDTTIHDSNIMVLGYGRIGKTVAHKLAGLGANVSVVARNYTDLAWISSYKYHAIHLENMEAFLYKMDTIINTIPALMLDESNLDKVKTDTVIVDVASSPGGVDFHQAAKLNIKAISALGLPGKVAPLYAANCIRETIYNIMYDLGVNK